MFDFIENEEVRAQAQEAHDSAITSLNDEFNTTLADATDGLKRSKATILDEKKKLEARFKGIDPDEVGDAVSFYEKNKDAKFLESGKIEELVEQKTSQLTADHDAVLGELNGNLESAQALGTKFKTLYETKILEDDIRAAALGAKVIPAALEDVISRAKNIFKLADDFTVEARDSEGNLRKDEKGIIVNPTNWMESLKTTAPHYWPASEGAGFSGSGSSGADSTDHLNNLASTDHAAFVKARKESMK